MKKFLFSILCINLFQTSLQHELFSNDNQKSSTYDNSNLKKTEYTISIEYTLGIDLPNLQDKLILSDDQKKLVTDYLNLKKMNKSIDNAIQTRIPLKTNELKTLQKYLKKQIQKRKNTKKFLSKINIHQPLPRDLCRQELLKNLPHKKITKFFN